MVMVPNIYISTVSGISGKTGFGPQGISGNSGCSIGPTGMSGSSGTAGFPSSSEYWIKQLNGTHSLNNNYKYNAVEEIIDGKKCLVYISISPPVRIITLDGMIQSINDKPAVFYGNNNHVEYWFKDNKLHRENGPAIEVKIQNGTKMYFLNDIEVSEEQQKNHNRYNRLKDILQN